MIHSVALVIHGCRRQRDRFAIFIRSADDVVTVLGVRSGGAHEARFLGIRNTYRQIPFSPPPGHGNGFEAH